MRVGWSAPLPPRCTAPLKLAFHGASGGAMPSARIAHNREELTISISIASNTYETDGNCERSCDRSCDSNMLIGSTKHTDCLAIKIHFKSVHVYAQEHTSILVYIYICMYLYIYIYYIYVCLRGGAYFVLLPRIPPIPAAHHMYKACFQRGRWGLHALCSDRPQSRRAHDLHLDSFKHVRDGWRLRAKL